MAVRRATSWVENEASLPVLLTRAEESHLILEIRKKSATIVLGCTRRCMIARQCIPHSHILVTHNSSQRNLEGVKRGLSFSIRRTKLVKAALVAKKRSRLYLCGVLTASIEYLFPSRFLNNSISL